MRLARTFLNLALLLALTISAADFRSPAWIGTVVKRTSSAPSEPVPPAPTGFSITAVANLENGNQWQVSCSWDPVPNAITYNVYYGEVDGGPYDFAGSTDEFTTSIEHISTDFTGCATTYYVVKVITNTVESAASSQDSMHIIGAPPSPVAVGEVLNIHLEWGAVSCATTTKYNIWRSIDGEMSYEFLASTNSLEYDDTDVDTMAEYFYYIVAHGNSHGDLVSYGSTHVSATPLDL